MSFLSNIYLIYCAALLSGNICRTGLFLSLCLINHDSYLFAIHSHHQFNHVWVLILDLSFDSTRLFLNMVGFLSFPYNFYVIFFWLSLLENHYTSLVHQTSFLLVLSSCQTKETSTRTEFFISYDLDIHFGIWFFFISISSFQLLILFCVKLKSNLMYTMVSNNDRNVLVVSLALPF